MKDRKSSAGEDAEAAKAEFSLIPHETLQALYRALLKARNGKTAVAASRRWRFDAAAVAIAQDLVAADTVIAESAVPPVSQAKIARAFGAELERAAGLALGHKTRKTGNVTVVFGGAGERDAWRDMLEVARVHRLPIIFVTELREEKNPAKQVGGLEPGTELAHIVVDGNDVVASYRVAYEAIQRARRDRGPTLIECTAFRIKGRRQQNPVAMMKAYLQAKGMLPA